MIVAIAWKNIILTLVLLASTVSAQTALGPLRVAAGAARYFVDPEDKPVYLAGSHDGWELQDYAWGDKNPGVKFNWEGYLDSLVEHRHNVVRLWCVEHTKINDDDSDLTSPMPHERARGHGKANDGGDKFDLTHFDEAYFDHLRHRTMQARDRGIYVIVMLFQGWSIEDKGGRVNPWPYHPFHRDNNVNGVDGDLDGDGRGKELHTWLGEDHRITRLQRAYVQRVIDTVGDLDNVLFEIANESHGESIPWQSRMTEYIHDSEKTRPKQHPVGITVPFSVPRRAGLNRDLFTGPADWISPNRKASAGYNYRDNPPPADGEKVVLLDTDHLFGTGCKDPTWVWKAFCRGHNPLYMDMWTMERNDPGRQEVRTALGLTRAMTCHIDLASALPHNELASTRLCLADPGRRYLVYAHQERAVTVDLSTASDELQVHWVNPRSGVMVEGPTVAGGRRRDFESPFEGDSVLLLRAVKSDSD